MGWFDLFRGDAVTRRDGSGFGSVGTGASRVGIREKLLWEAPFGWFRWAEEEVEAGVGVGVGGCDYDLALGHDGRGDLEILLSQPQSIVSCLAAFQVRNTNF